VERFDKAVTGTACDGGCPWRLSFEEKNGGEGNWHSSSSRMFE
jgi:hypothetical protein